MSRHHLPFEPLEQQLVAEIGDRVAMWADCLETDRSHLRRMRSKGWVSLATGERYAFRLGLHPLEICVDYYELAGAA